MMISVWEMIAVFALSWLCTMAAVMVGGYLVYRTKRESYEPFVSVRNPDGMAFNTDDGFALDTRTDTKTELPKSVLDATDRFTAQFAESLANRAAKGGN